MRFEVIRGADGNVALAAGETTERLRRVAGTKAYGVARTLYAFEVDPEELCRAMPGLSFTRCPDGQHVPVRRGTLLRCAACGAEVKEDEWPAAE